MKKAFFLALMCLAAGSLFGQRRSFDDLFPGLDPEQKRQAFSGVLTETRDRDFYLGLSPAGEPGTKIAGFVLDGIRPACLVESLTVVPYLDAPLELLDLYNAVGKIRNLSGRLYHSASRDENVPLFENATRIQGPKNFATLPDPENSASLPAAERVYIRLKDANFGNSYYQGDISFASGALFYGLTNFRSLTYGIFPVIKEGNFIAQFYVAPLVEGILVYSAATAEVGGFVSEMVSVSSAIRKRIEVILGWLVDAVAMQ